MTRLLLALLAILVFAQPAVAQPADPALRAQAERVVTLLRGQGDPAALFSPAFLAQVPADRVRAIAAQLTGQYGAVRALAALDAQSATAGTLRVDYERAVVTITVQIAPAPPHLINGLLVTNVEMRGDTMTAVLAELRALPGQTGLAIARLGDGPPVLVASHEPDRPLAIGSTFKLVILAELSRQVRACQRRWSDVVPLDRRSIPTGALQNWPAGAPLTLHTLAAMMISVSDNTATDTLLHLLGRETVERMMTTLGFAAPGRNRPFLSTLEMAAIKAGGEPAIAAWRAADEAGRRRRLAAYTAADAARIDTTLFAGNPIALDIEWFASPSDLVRVMDWLRREGDESARAILTINPALAPALRGNLAYVGYKGGSESGVLNLTWLIRTRAGEWLVATSSWNNPAAPVEESRLIGLMARAIRLASGGQP
ncbi:serine hydrolase [Sphingosinicella sp.]|uniref:serine hydrolase n=1 Tax=Sphingosinicella sp. TaxID=1917971 RepID=UPI004037A8CE